MFAAAKRALSPTSLMGNNNDKDGGGGGGGDESSYADTYFREIGFKTGDNSLIGSTESPELDGDDRLLRDSDSDFDRSLGLLEDNSLATDVERAVAAAGGSDDFYDSKNDSFKDNPRSLYPPQAATAAMASRPKSQPPKGLSMSQAYSAPFHSYFGAFDREQYNDDSNSNNNNIIGGGVDDVEDYDASPTMAHPNPGPRSYDIVYPDNGGDDVSISTLGEESVRRLKVSPLNAPPQRAAAVTTAAPPAAIVSSARKSRKSSFLLQGGTAAPKPAGRPLPNFSRDDDNDNDNDGDALDLKKTRTGSTLEERPTEGDDGDGNEQQGPSSSRFSKNSNGIIDGVDAQALLASKRRSRFIYCIIGTAVILLSAAAVALGFSVVAMNKESDNSEDASFSKTWVPRLPNDWTNSSSSSNNAPTNAPAVATTTSSNTTGPVDALVELAREDVLQILATVAPESLASIGDTLTPQYQAFDWLVHDPSYLDYTVERVLQRWSMAVLYFSLGGDNWRLNPPTAARRRLLSEEPVVLVVGTEWLDQSTHECLWYTTTTATEDVCDDEGRIVGLHLAQMGLSGSIPPEIALLSPSLERVYLPYNNITGTLPFEMGDLSHLVLLQLTSNAIQGTLPPEIAKLSDLVVLGLGRNQMAGSIPTSLGVLSNLSTLGLEGNNLRGTIPTELGRMTSLEFLTLESNQLRGDIPSEMGALENLEVFAVHQNRFQGSMPEEVCAKIVTNMTNLVVSADCAEIECECCALCCKGCDGENQDSGVLIDNVPTAAPSAMSELLQPAMDDLQQQANQQQVLLWPSAIGAAGVKDSMPSHIASGAPSFAPSVTSTKTSTDSPTAFPTENPTECVPQVSTQDKRSSCFENNGDTIQVEFQNCDATESDWIGLFEDEDEFEGSRPLGRSAPSANDAELWMRACGSRQCNTATNSGRISFGNGRLRVKEGDYRILVVRDGTTIATTQAFEVRRNCK